MNSLWTGSANRSMDFLYGSFRIGAKLSVHRTNPVSTKRAQSGLDTGIFQAKLLLNGFKDEDIAVKILKRTDNSDREISIQTSIPHHPNIVTLLFCGSLGPINTSSSRLPPVFIAMELCDTNLEDHIQELKQDKNEFQSHVMFSYSEQVMKGLDFLHKHQIIHGDLKPSNILLKHNNTIAKICDFGASRTKGSEFHPSETGPYYTAAWGAPEVSEKSGQSVASDIFSMGLVLYYILSCGKHPFHKPNGSFVNIIRGNPTFNDIEVSVPDEVKDLIKDMLSREPENRPSSKEIRSKIEQIATASGSEFSDESDAYDEVKPPIGPKLEPRREFSDESDAYDEVIPPIGPKLEPRRDSEMMSISTEDGEIISTDSLLHSDQLLDFGIYLAHGQFGGKPDTSVAIKVTGTVNPLLAKEEAILRCLDHENIVKCFHSDKVGSADKLKKILVLECVEQTLKRYAAMLAPDLERKIKFSLQIASGLAYLERKKGVHCDLRADNIYIKSGENITIGGFHYASMKPSVPLTPNRLHDRWMAPEVFSEGTLTQKSDIWSFGLVLYEVFTNGADPYPGLNDTEVIGHVTVGRQCAMPENSPKWINKVLKKCWRKTPDHRSTFEYYEDFIGDSARSDNPDM